MKKRLTSCPICKKSIMPWQLTLKLAMLSGQPAHLDCALDHIDAVVQSDPELRRWLAEAVASDPDSVYSEADMVDRSMIGIRGVMEDKNGKVTVIWDNPMEQTK